MSAAELTLAELDAFETRDELVDELTRRASQSCALDETPSWYWTKSNRGSASTSSWAIKVPEWAGNNESVLRAWYAGHRTRLFLAYYVVHEVAHLPADSYGHGPAFKQYERDALAELGVGIRYMRTYPSILFDLETGEELYVSDKELQRRRRVPERRQQRERARELLAAGVAPERIGYMRRTRVGLFDGEWLPLPR